MTERDTAERLLDAAEALLAEHGPDGLSLRQVARETGITPMAVYRHYDGLEALRDALRDRGYERLMTHFRDVLAEPDPRSRLEASAREYVRFATRNPQLFRLLFSGGPPPETAAKSADRRRNATSFRFMVDRVREGIDAGILPPGDPEARAIDWWGLFHGLVVLQQEGKLKLEPDAFDAHIDSTLAWLLLSR
ncbi:MAG: TetR/AcrR family transcriptional regulator [Myxococcota bacterium]